MVMDRFEIDGHEVTDRDVKPTGNDVHIYVPKR